VPAFPIHYDPVYLLLSLVPLAMMLSTFFAAFMWRNRKRRMAWSIRNANVVQNGKAIAPGVDVSLADGSLESMSVARIALWNARLPTFTTDGRVSNNAGTLCISTSDPNVRILNAEAIQTNVDCGDVTVRLGFNKRDADVSLPPLASRQGAVFRVVHTGTSADDIRVTSDDHTTALRFYAPEAVVPAPKSIGNKPIRVTPWRLFGLMIGIYVVMILVVIPLAHRFTIVGTFLDSWNLVGGFAAIASVAFHLRTRPNRMKNKVILPRELNSFFEG
jgi:hypothetical protein